MLEARAGAAHPLAHLRPTSSNPDFPPERGGVVPLANGGEAVRVGGVASKLGFSWSSNKYSRLGPAFIFHAYSDDEHGNNIGMAP